MKVVPVALVVVLLAWVMFVCAATTTIGEITGRKSPPPPPPRPQPIVLDLEGVTDDKYSEVITTVRRELSDKSCFEIPMLRKLSQSEYMYVKLISATGSSIVVAINKKDIYVQGYSYKDGTQARCFKDVFTTCKVIFPTATTLERIDYTGSYIDLQRKAGVGTDNADRSKVPLGMTVLGSYIDKISQTKPSNFAQNEAKLLLIVIQMVSEAVRFKYIENQVKNNIPYDFNPDPKVISLENNWGQLSKAIASVTSETESFSKSFTLTNAKGGEWIVKNVKDIKPDMGLLNYVEDSLRKCPSKDYVPVSAQ